MSEKTVVNNNGVGFVGLLQLLFIGLKLTGYVTWSWWIVFSPLIATSCIITLIVLTIFGLIMYKESK